LKIRPDTTPLPESDDITRSLEAMHGATATHEGTVGVFHETMAGPDRVEGLRGTCLPLKAIPKGKGQGMGDDGGIRYIAVLNIPRSIPRVIRCWLQFARGNI